MEWSFKKAITIQTYSSCDPIPVPVNFVSLMLKCCGWQECFNWCRNRKQRTQTARVSLFLLIGAEYRCSRLSKLSHLVVFLITISYWGRRGSNGTPKEQIRCKFLAETSLLLVAVSLCISKDISHSITYV